MASSWKISICIWTLTHHHIFYKYLHRSLIAGTQMTQPAAPSQSTGYHPGSASSGENYQKANPLTSRLVFQLVFVGGKYGGVEFQLAEGEKQDTLSTLP